jgi:hypothetical protein
MEFGLFFNSKMCNLSMKFAFHPYILTFCDNVLTMKYLEI